MTGTFPQPGRLFADKYQIERLLGSGGFARVYLANQTELGRQVAIKVLNLELPTDENETDEVDPAVESIARRFEREARIVSQLRSPQTITIYDYGRTDDGMLYMVMEYIDGVELDEEPVPIEPRRAVKILRQVLESLREAHAHGLLHRDLKPANIMLFTHLGQKDHVKLLDFGIAKVVGDVNNDAGADLTSADSLIGTPRYMSPEQIRGEEVGPPSDIYSLGLVFYELLVGAKAITNTDSIEILSKHLASEPFEIPSEQRIHPELRRVLNKMLAKKLSERYATTEEILADLERLDQLEGDLRTGGPPTLDALLPDLDELALVELDEDAFERVGPPDFTLDSEKYGNLEQSPEKRRRSILLIALLVFTVCGVGALLWWQSTPPAELDDASATAQQPSEDDSSTADPLAENAEDSDDQGSQARDHDEALPLITLIRTRPSGATVWLDDRMMGMSPVQFDANHYEFPLTVRAQLGEYQLEKTLAKPGGELWLDLPIPDKELTSKAPGQLKPGSSDKGANSTGGANGQNKKNTGARPIGGGAGNSAGASKPSKPASENAASAKPSPPTRPAKPKPPVDTRKYLPLD